MFYVYQHRRADTNAIFYVGKGHGNRCSYKHGRNAKWSETIKNAGGFTFDIIISDIDEDLALLAEVELIDKYRRLGFLLTNATIGGEGVVGLKHSADAKRRMSEAKKGKTSPRKGVKLSPEACAKISAVQKGVPKPKRSPEHQEKINAVNRGSKRNEESRLKMSLAKKGKPKGPLSEATKAKLRYLALDRHAKKTAVAHPVPDNK